MGNNLILLIISPVTAWIPLLRGGIKQWSEPIKIVFHPIILGIIGLFFCSVASAIYNQDWLSLMASFALILYFILVQWAERELTTFEKLHRVFRECWLISLIPALLGILEKLISLNMDMTWLVKLFWNPTYFPTIGNYRIMSTFGNPNVAGDWFGLMSLLGFYLLESCGYEKRKLIVVGNCLFLTALLLTGSKGAMISYLASAVVFAVLKHSKKTWKFLLFFFALSSMGILSFFNLFETYNTRAYIWEACIKIFKESPIFGCGILGLYPKIHEVHGHNLFFSIAATLGIVGLILAFMILGYLAKTLWKLNQNRIRMAPILTSMMTFLWIHSMVDFTILTPQVGTAFFAIAAVITRFERVFLDKEYFAININLSQWNSAWHRIPNGAIKN